MYSQLKKKTRIFALIIILVMFFEIIPSIDFSTMTVAAATEYGTDIINAKWEATMDALDWESTRGNAVQKDSSSEIYLPTENYWHDTSDSEVNWVDINNSSVTIDGTDADDKIGKKITITGGTGTVPTTTETEYKTTTDGTTYHNAYAYDGTNYGGTVAQYAYRETMRPTFDGDVEATSKTNVTATTSSTREEAPVMLDVATSTLRILGEAQEETVEVTTTTNTLRVEEASSPYYDKVVASDLNGGIIDLDIEASLYYTVDYDEMFNVNYRTYYISTANQLAYLLYFYSYSQTTLHTDSTTYANYPSYYNRFLETTSNCRIKFVFLNDLDLGGKNGQYWEHYLEQIYAYKDSDRFSNGRVMAYRNTQVYMTMEGKGHVIYNGYFKDFENESESTGFDSNGNQVSYYGSTTQFIGGHTSRLTATTGTSGDSYVFLMNFNFENMYSSSSNFEGGCPLLGHSTTCGYLYNIHCIHCIAIQTSATRGSILIGGCNRTYVKYCSVEESYVYGNTHAGLMSSNVSGSSSYSTSANINSAYPGCVVANSTSNGTDNAYGGNVFTYAGDEMEDLAAEEKLLQNNGESVTYNSEKTADKISGCCVLWYPTTVPDADVAAATFKGYNFYPKETYEATGSLPSSNFVGNYELDGKEYYIYRSTSNYYGKSTVSGAHRVLNGLNIFEDSYTIDSLVFDTNSSGHSGTFSSCTSGMDAYINCFSNCTIYAMTRTGVFCGNANGRTRGTFMKVDTNGDGVPDTRTLVNNYFENCFTSGSVEGQSMLGGFIGGIYEHSYGGESDAVGICVFENCYSTSSVGMAYSGNSCGGFVGSIRGNVGTAVQAYNASGSLAFNSNGREVLNESVSKYDEETGYYTTKTGYFNDLDHLFVNCYAAGEVGGITTATTDRTSFKDENKNAIDPTSIGGFFGEIRYSYLYLFGAGAQFVNCYYDKQTTGMREKVIGDLNNTATVTNYYDYASYNNSYTKGSSDCANYYHLGYFINAANAETTGLKIPDGGYVISLTDITYTYSDGTQAVVHPYPATLNDTLYDITGKEYNYNEIIHGVYTQASAQKGVKGLTDTVRFNENCSIWQYTTEFYPQLSVYYDSTNWVDSDQATLVYNYAAASTAAVFLSHYDTMLSEDEGKEYDADEKDATVYDTIRDITQKFTFTSADLSGNYNGKDGIISWACDQTTGSKNMLDRFIATFGDETGYSLDYENGEGIYTKTENPNVLSIVISTDNNKLVYKCNEFSPGKQWVTVHYGQNGKTLGERHLRLLPSAYLDAGGMITVQVIEDENGENGETTLSNTVKLNAFDSSGDTKNVELDHFTHSVGVVYALSDKTRMSEMYDNHVLTEYVEEISATDDTETFAFYGRYGLTAGDKLNNTVGELLDQDFTEEEDINLSEQGETIVRIYKTYIDGTTLMRDAEVECTPVGNETTELSTAQENYLKWTGQEEFDSGDVGYYYMYYYWRLDDGRYLYDIKLVDITVDTHEINLVTGILDTERDLVENGQGSLVMDVDQYIALNNDSTVSHPSGDFYPSYQEDFNIENPLDYYNKGYNYAHEYYDGVYYCNAQSLTLTPMDNAVVCWKESSEENYVLTNVIIEVMAQGNTEWEEILGVAVNENGDITGVTDKDELLSAQYSYIATKYTVTQDPETKLFVVAQNQVEEETTLQVEYQKNEVGTCNISINFNMGDGEKSNVLDNIRVTALYRERSPKIQADKSVLWVDEEYGYEAYNADDTYIVTDTARQGAATDDDDASSYKGHPISWNTYVHGGSYTYRDNNQDVTVKYPDQSVDNTGVEKEKRQAVLAGDPLTYRIMVRNNGDNEAKNVVVTDTVPEGCAYVEGSAKIYRQKYSSILTSNTAYYGDVEPVTNEEGYTCSYSGADNDGGGTITWNLAAVTDAEYYYLEYEVTVDAIAPSVSCGKLENIAYYTYNDDSDDSNGEKTGQTNTVETDVIHLYLDIQKIIEQDDADQSFLYAVKYYEEKPTAASEPSEVYYVDLRTGETTDETGNVYYMGDAFVQIDKRGYVTVEEINAWSITDYDFKAVTAINGDANYISVTSPTGNDDNTSVQIAYCVDKTALPTAIGLRDAGRYPIVTYTNKQSIYAYRSADAYAGNTFVENNVVVDAITG